LTAGWTVAQLATDFAVADPRSFEKTKFERRTNADKLFDFFIEVIGGNAFFHAFSHAPRTGEEGNFQF